LPAAVNGVVTGFMLAVARGVGETAPLLFTVLGNDRYDIARIFTSSPSIGDALTRVFEQPTDGLTLTMWKYASQPFPERVQLAWAVALVLMLFTLGINILARFLTSRGQMKSQQ
jgi:phosphate transport system permease protein